MTSIEFAGPQLPLDDFAGDGYDYIETAEKAGWTVISQWGGEGYDFGAWPYIIGFARQAQDASGQRHFGYGLYVEGDTTTKYFDNLEACKEAIDRDAHFFWKTGQSDGPEGVPEQFEKLPEKYRGLPND
ncbi:hypothetical protein ACTXL8_15795 [Glutamicibacter arilaitensis]|uniref:hypothetical protein n=1 Tax=Glutamicibacter arilaitensis TaxID=256701 RepID=UPI003FCFFA44